MNGAQALIRTLAEAGTDVCFANPGTSEMHFVAALDEVPAMRGILCLSEGAVTGAADGFGRMTGRPAVALLHLGPGLANGLANLHNARRAGTPLLAVVGDHASYHKRYDAPLESDIDALAGSVSRWVRRCARTADVTADAAEAVAAAMTPPGGVATLILPADVSWSEGAEPARPSRAEGTGPARPSRAEGTGPARPSRAEGTEPARTPPADGAETGQPSPVRAARVSPDAIESAAAALRGGGAIILLGGAALTRAGLEAAGRIAAATGARLLAETFPARHERGAGIPAADRLAYFGELAAAQLQGARHLILAGAREPVSFFAYPGRPSYLVPDCCDVLTLAGPGDDIPGALTALADLVAPGVRPVPAQSARPAIPDGDLTAEKAAAVIGALLPEGAIVSDEAITSGLWSLGATAGAPPHDWLSLTGGAIGQGIPLATGAAIACPGRPVLALEADGSAMYTICALWTQAREGLDVTTVIFSNRRYAILGMELARVGAAAAGGASTGLLELSRPDLDFTAIAAGMGVPASRAATAGEFAAQLRRALAEPGPHLIEAIVPPVS